MDDPTDVGADRADDVQSDLDARPSPVDTSRWWYWIAAYPIYTLLMIPLAIFSLLVFAPLGLVAVPAETDPGAVAPIAVITVIVLFGALMLYALGGLILTVMLPIGLYMDADAIATSDIRWDPDPILYGLLGLVNFLAAPIIGIVVALYYLYKRHQYIGIP